MSIYELVKNEFNLLNDRIAELESQLAHKEELRQEALGCLKNATSRADKLQAQLDECVDYLKDGETIAECIQRNRDDASSTLTLLAKEKRKSEELQAQLDEVVLVTCAKHSPRTINEIGCPYCQTEQAESQLAAINEICFCDICSEEVQAISILKPTGR